MRSALLCLPLLIAPILSADVLFQTGFEPTETPPYVTGPLIGQNGWQPAIGNIHPVVQTTTVFSGVQAVQMDATGGTAVSYVRHGISDPLAEKTVVIRLRFQQSTAGNSSVWTPISLYGNGSGGFMGQIVVRADGTAALGPQRVPIARGSWHLFEITIDFDARTISGTVDNIWLGSVPIANDSTSLTSIWIGLNNAPGTDSAYWDDLYVVNPAAFFDLYTEWFFFS